MPRWSLRSVVGIVAALAATLAAGALFALASPLRGLLPGSEAPHQPPRRASLPLVQGLLSVRRRAGTWLPSRRLRAWVAPLYRAAFLRLSGYPAAAAALAREHVRAEDAVLDVGAGRGEIALEAARIARRVDATDSAAGAVERARHLLERRPHLRATFRRAPATALPYPNGYFSLVLSGLLLPALPRSLRQQVLAEMHRVLRPGGRVAFFIGPAEMSAVPTSESQWQRFVARAGFHDVVMEGSGSLFPVLRARKPEAET